MMKRKCFCTLLIMLVLLSCGGGSDGNNNKIIGDWQYVRMERTDLQSSVDTMQLVLMEAVYRGSVLRFVDDETFIMSKQDSTSNFEGDGTYEIDARAQTLTMEGNVRNSNEDRMTVQIFELTADSLKIGSREEIFVYSRMKK